MEHQGFEFIDEGPVELTPEVWDWILYGFYRDCDPGDENDAKEGARSE